MTKKEKIRKLENKVLELEARIRSLESRNSWIYTIPEITYPKPTEWIITCGNTH